MPQINDRGIESRNKGSGLIAGFLPSVVEHFRDVAQRARHLTVGEGAIGVRQALL